MYFVSFLFYFLSRCFIDDNTSVGTVCCSGVKALKFLFEGKSGVDKNKLCKRFSSLHFHKKKNTQFSCGQTRIY